MNGVNEHFTTPSDTSDYNALLGVHNGLHLGKNKEHSIQAITNDDVLCPPSQFHCDLLLCSSVLGFSISLERRLRFGWNPVLDTHRLRKQRTTCQT
jgi:hypothetical protein